jgi:thermitase
MAKFNKLVGIVAAAAVLTTLAPMGASAAVVTEKAVAKADVAKEHATDQILVKAKAGKDLKANAQKHGATKVEELSGAWKLVKVPAGKAAEFVEKFNADADVEMAELDYIHTVNLTPNDPSYGSQWHLPKIQANYAWDIHTGGSTATIAIVDTGVDIQHSDLSSKIVAGYDFVNNDTNADDDQGHGTHCAGIAAATGNNSYQGTGVSMGARIMPVKVLSSTGSGTTSNIIKGVDFAKNNGAHIISMSLGGGGYSQAFQDSINSAWSAGKVVIAAAGNNGNTTVQYPAGYANVISVAATTSTDAKASFSTYGSWVDVAAPGASIYATANGGGMTTMSGTSMATPVVAGLAALLKSKNTAASATAIRDRIFNTTDRITGTGSYWYYGRVNAYKAVNGF